MVFYIASGLKNRQEINKNFKKFYLLIDMKANFAALVDICICIIILHHYQRKRQPVPSRYLRFVKLCSELIRAHFEH